MSRLPTLLVVTASTRSGRVGLPVAEWFSTCATDHGGFEVEVADLAEIDLPVLDEPSHPRLRQYTHQHTIDWSGQVNSADAFAFVTPEYNYGPSPRWSTRSATCTKSGSTSRRDSSATEISRAGRAACRSPSRWSRR